MNFGEAIASGFQNYVTFSGRASRSEYWYWVLFTVLGGIATAIIDRSLFDTSTISPLNAIFNLICFLPSFAVAFRRLHVPRYSIRPRLDWTVARCRPAEAPGHTLDAAALL